MDRDSSICRRPLRAAALTGLLALSASAGCAGDDAEGSASAPTEATGTTAATGTTGTSADATESTDGATTGATATEGTSASTGATSSATETGTTTGDGESSSTTAVDDPAWDAFVDARASYLEALAAPIVACIQQEDTAHPAFHGCIDWHSAVHASYALLALYRLTGEPSYLELVDATLDPGGYRQHDGARAPTILGMSLREPYGFVDGDEERAFAESPTVRLRRSIAGPVRLDRGLRLTESIVDAGAGVDTAPGVAPLAIAGATPDAAGDLGYAAPTAIDRATIFGQALLESLHGRGVVFVHRVAVHDHQRGCLRQSYVAGGGDTLPPNLGCVSGLDDAASLAFVGERYADPSYAQLADRSDRRIRTRGPEDDAMGAFGFLLPAHAWQNLELRLRENMPVGVRALLLPVT